MQLIDLVTLLQESVPGITPAGIRKWGLALQSHSEMSLDIVADADWVTVSCGMLMPNDASAIALLLQQSAWPSNARIDCFRSRPALRSEVPLLVDTDANCAWVSRQLASTVTSMRSALGHVIPQAKSEHDSHHDADPETLAERCRAAGWPASPKPDGQVRVDIESRSARRVVHLARQHRALRASVMLDMGHLGEADDERIEAIAYFLLRASASLRFARAWASGTASGISEAGFECFLEPPAEDEPLVTAIDALATASDWFGREAESLIESTAVAREYLRSSAPGRRLLARQTTRHEALAVGNSEPFAASAAAIASTHHKETSSWAQ